MLGAIAGSSRVLRALGHVGRALLDEQGRARAVWVDPSGSGSVRTVPIDLRRGRVGPEQKVLRGCRPDPFRKLRALSPVGRVDGPLAFSVPCGDPVRWTLLQPDLR